MREAARFIAGQSGSPSPGAFTKLLGFMHAPLKSWPSRRGLSRLADLDDHILADVGLTREDIAEITAYDWTHGPRLELRPRDRYRQRRGWRE